MLDAWESQRAKYASGLWRPIKRARVLRKRSLLFLELARTLQRWCKRYERTGSTHPKARGHRKAVYSGKELKRLDRVIGKHPDATLEELRKLTGKSCSIMAVQRAVVRLGYSLKKNAIGQRTKPA